ncbi:PDZ domain-containing protein [Hephaestia sp. GCM10023244]|uniref:PDZ domain-containing protein n=1 Tax=unclassified Hephaestia TaxID=2631281 RepID=UPI0020772C7E|nr:PDZ domain-containing protein [Hephaestia sp. MAHUQ-44]MCM8729886.1 PDZ domain-containing protein [Hephaestia sp. MAHUQ-44]
MNNKRKKRIRAGLLALIGIAPLAVGAVLVATPAGRSVLGPWAGPIETRALLPGLTVEATPARGHGLVVTSLRSGGEAMTSGIMVGDRIVAIDDHPVGTMAQTLGYMHKDERRTVVLGLVRHHDVHRVQLRRDRKTRHGA